MHIVQVCKYSFLDVLGGVEQAVKNIALYTMPYGCQHTILVTSEVKQVETQVIDGIRIIKFPMSLNLSSCPMSYRMLKEFKTHVQDADIVHYHFPWPYGDLMHVLNGIEKSSIVTYHSDIIKQKMLKHVYAPLMAIFLKRVDSIVVTSKNYLATSKVLKPYRDKCCVIPMGIDRETYPPINPGKVEAFQNHFGKNFILFVGVLRYYKGLHTLLEAVKNTDIQLVIAGDGPCAEELKAKAIQLNLSQVHFLGSISEEDKIALLSICRALVLPSHLRSEAFGLSLVEGLMMGKPLVSSEIGTGTSFVNIDQETGFVVPPEDPESLKQALLKLTQDDALARQMGNNAKARYDAIFTAEAMGKAYFELYCRIQRYAGSKS